MAKVGRPKLVENMDPWETKVHKRRQAMKGMTPEQIKAVVETREALQQFIEQWRSSFDCHDISVPRKLQSALSALKNQFPQD